MAETVLDSLQKEARALVLLFLKGAARTSRPGVWRSSLSVLFPHSVAVSALAGFTGELGESVWKTAKEHSD